MTPQVVILAESAVNIIK